MGPARTIKHSPNQPKLSTTHIESSQEKCFIVISSVPLFCMPAFLWEALNNNRAGQKALNSLKDFPNVLRIIKHMMEDDADNNTFSQILWGLQTQAMT
jgi:hypothetical protein